MTDPDLIAKKLALIETSVGELRTLARPEALGRDVKEQRFVVDLAVVRDVLVNRLDDLLAFVRTIRARLT